MMELGLGSIKSELYVNSYAKWWSQKLQLDGFLRNNWFTGFGAREYIMYSAFLFRIHGEILRHVHAVYTTRPRICKV